jgi:hypothetical protein
MLRRVAVLSDGAPGNRPGPDAQQAKPTGSEPTPEPAVPPVLEAFDKYQVVGRGEAHGDKDQDDFILSLIRNPAFLEKVNDIAVECGNSLYQPILDRSSPGSLTAPISRQIPRRHRLSLGASIVLLLSRARVSNFLMAFEIGNGSDSSNCHARSTVALTSIDL